MVNREKLLTLIQSAFHEGGLLLENGALRAAANRFYTGAMYGVMLFLDEPVQADETIWRLGSRYLRKSAKIYKTSLEIRKLRGSIEFSIEHEPSLSDVKRLSKLCTCLVRGVWNKRRNPYGTRNHTPWSKTPQSQESFSGTYPGKNSS